MTGPNESAAGDIAIVGMAVDLPGAPTLDAFWQLLSESRTAIRRLSPEELAQAGVPEETSQRPDYVPFGAPLEGHDRFDAGFFGLHPALDLKWKIGFLNYDLIGTLPEE